MQGRVRRTEVRCHHCTPGVVLGSCTHEEETTRDAEGWVPPQALFP